MEQQLISFFKHYWQFFEQQNIEHTLACYQLPCLMVAPEQVTFIEHQQDLYDLFEQLFAGLSAANVLSFNVKAASYQVIADNLILACIDWQFLQQDGTVYTEFCAIYHLVIKNDQIKIQQVISHDSEHRLRLAHSLQLSKGKS